MTTPTHIPPTFGARLRAAREAKGWSIKQLVEQSDMAPLVERDFIAWKLTRLESGMASAFDLRVGQLDGLCGALEVTPNYLLGWEEKP